MENTPRKGQYRWMIYRDGKEWVGAILEFNIVIVGDDRDIVSHELQESALGYIESARKIKGFRPRVVNPTLNQKSDPQLERLWKDAYEARIKRIPFPSNIFDFGARNLALV